MGHVTGAFVVNMYIVHQFELFAILPYVVKMVIKPRIFNPVAMQPIDVDMASCLYQIVVR